MNAKDLVKLVEAGKMAEAHALLKTLMDKAENEPDEIISETGQPAVFKRRGKLVVLDEDGNWKLKNPSQRKK